jgi:WD40 repeat protein
VDGGNGETLFSVPPQLSTHCVTCTMFDALACKLCVLLANSHVHVWYISTTQPPKLVDVWTQHEREKLSCMSLFVKGSIPQERANKLGLCSETGELLDFIIAANTDGDLIFLSSDTGQIRLRFCAHKLTKITHVLVDGDHHRLLTVTSHAVKVWDLSRGMKMLSATISISSTTCVALLQGWFLLGMSSGALRFISVIDGQEMRLLSDDAHLSRIASVQASAFLQHAVSSSPDGTLMLWDVQRRLVRTVLIARPVTCACFLNNTGDLLCGIGHELVIIRSNLYNTVRAPKQTRGEQVRCDPCAPANSPSYCCCSTPTNGVYLTMCCCYCKAVERRHHSQHHKNVPEILSLLLNYDPCRCHFCFSELVTRTYLFTCVARAAFP